MPPLPSIILLDTLVDRNAATTVSSSAPPANTAGHALQVVCAWPVSGQYGPGSRVLYYVLIAVCVFARKAEWLKNVCLAAALLFPAVAAIHGIVLAATHIEGAVDMDVYGALQFCSIGILAAQVTVRNSRTYFNAPGRNTIFLWTGLVLAGLLSLAVEFYRIKTSDCPYDSGRPISLNAAEFPYGNNLTCGLTCSTDLGPFSPLRGGSANNIYVIPAPDNFTFGMAMLMITACGIPAILSLMWMWKEILKINWNTRFGDRDDNEQIEGTNGATFGKMKGVNKMIRFVLGGVEIIIFGGAVLAIIIIGERNFFSSQVRYQTEPMASIGQWAPIAGTGLAAIGSLYLLLAKDVEEGASLKASMRNYDGSPEAGASSQSVATPCGSTDIRPQYSNELLSPSGDRRPSQSTIGGHRRKVTKALTAFANYFGSVRYDRFDDSAFRRGDALNYPQVPAEEYRNRRLTDIQNQYNLTPVQRSRAASRTRSRSSSPGIGSSLTTLRAGSARSPQSPSSFPSAYMPRRPGPQNGASSSSTGEMLQGRRLTLEVPPQVYLSPPWDS